MSLPPPAPIAPKTSTQNNEVATATSISDILRIISLPQIRVSKNSPPGPNDLNEMSFIFDKTTLRLWIQINGVGHYIQFT